MFYPTSQLSSKIAVRNNESLPHNINLTENANAPLIYATISAKCSDDGQLDYRDYQLTRVGQLFQYDVPLGKRGLLRQFAGHRVRLVCTYNGQFRKRVRVDWIAFYVRLRSRPLQAPYPSSQTLSIASTALMKKSTRLRFNQSWSKAGGACQLRSIRSKA